MALAYNLQNGQRAERKTLITVVEFTPVGGTTTVKELLGTRTEDSSIEYNADIETTTDILGNNYSDMTKTQPEQSFDPSPIVGGSPFQLWLNDKRRRNALSELSGLTVYIITAFLIDGTPQTDNGMYACEKHTDCSVTYDSIGGDTNVNMPFTIHFSNKIRTGTVDKLTADFMFHPDDTSVTITP